KSLGANSTEGVVALTVAGEDLLVARRGEWAVVMDPDQRERLTQLASGTSTAPALIANYKKWIDANDITVVAFESGVRQLVSWSSEAGDDFERGNDKSDDLFGRNGRTTRRRFIVNRANRASSDGMKAVLIEFHKWAAASPAITQAIQQANM